LTKPAVSPLTINSHHTEYISQIRKQTESLLTGGMAMLKSRVEEVNRRIRESEKFPRIRDAEREMAQSESRFIKRQVKRKKKRELQAKGEVSNIPKLPPVGDFQDFFSGHVLNRDPQCSKFMPFDEVYFPNMFNPQIISAPPHSIDHLWLLGFRHEAIKPKKQSLLQQPGTNFV
jgi:uncharacterized protein YlzI (FlbEa/FlbD family)